LTWKDQGRGGQKGKVKIALMREGIEIASETICKNVAPHTEETVERTLKTEDVITKAEKGDFYALFHVVGGGGGH
jgi:hypothetical protein